MTITKASLTEVVVTTTKENQLASTPNLEQNLVATHPWSVVQEEGTSMDPLLGEERSIVPIDELRISTEDD